MKIINIALFTLLIFANYTGKAQTTTNTSEEFSEEQPYWKECCSINNSNEIVEIYYYTETNSLLYLLVVDFETQQSLYLEKNEQGNTVCKGSFDVASYDTTKKYTTTVWFLDVDGLSAKYRRYNFNFMKRGIWSYYYSNGVLQMRGNYVQNERDGIWHFYSPTAELEIIRTYDMGKIMNDEVVATGAYYGFPK